MLHVAPATLQSAVAPVFHHPIASGPAGEGPPPSAPRGGGGRAGSEALPPVSREAMPAAWTPSRGRGHQWAAGGGGKKASFRPMGVRREREWGRWRRSAAVRRAGAPRGRWGRRGGRGRAGRCRGGAAGGGRDHRAWGGGEAGPPAGPPRGWGARPGGPALHVLSPHPRRHEVRHRRRQRERWDGEAEGGRGVPSAPI